MRKEGGGIQHCVKRMAPCRYQDVNKKLTFYWNAECRELLLLFTFVSAICLDACSRNRETEDAVDMEEGTIAAIYLVVPWWFVTYFCTWRMNGNCSSSLTFFFHSLLSPPPPPSVGAFKKLIAVSQVIIPFANTFLFLSLSFQSQRDKSITSLVGLRGRRERGGGV